MLAVRSRATALGNSFSIAGLNICCWSDKNNPEALTRTAIDIAQSQAVAELLRSILLTAPMCAVFFLAFEVKALALQVEPLGGGFNELNLQNGYKLFVQCENCLFRLVPSTRDTPDSRLGSEMEVHLGIGPDRGCDRGRRWGLCAFGGRARSHWPMAKNGKMLLVCEVILTSTLQHGLFETLILSPHPRQRGLAIPRHPGSAVGVLP